MSEKLIPHTANALTTGLTDKLGDAEHLAVSQKGVKEAVSGATFEDAPSDGKFYARKDGQWVAIDVTAIWDKTVVFGETLLGEKYFG